ncbi:MAG TPA: HAMP domain-containing sensor histidine kinase [Conexibacter sp.]
MRSLRARLVAGLLLLAAVGLVVLAVITYAEQRSFLLDRVDQQLRDAGPPLVNELAAEGVVAAGSGHRPGPGGAGRRPGPGAGGMGDVGGAGAPSANGPGAGGPPPGGQPGGGPATSLPPGTWGALYNAEGERVGDPVVIAFGSDTTSAAQPQLPSSFTPGEAFTVGDRGGGNVRFRALATQPPVAGGGTIVAAIPLTDIDQTLNRLLLVEGLVIAGVLLVLGAGAWLLVRVGLRPLDRIAHTAGKIAGGDLSRRVAEADPRSETGRLGLAFNGMLDRLEVAFEQRRESEERLRRFLADASHELRTPLASIRGYAELFRIGAARSPADTEKAMRRIEEEAARMGVLVEDLLALARLDEVREAEHGPVDLAALARDAVDDARASAPEREISLRVGGDPRAATNLELTPSAAAPPADLDAAPPRSATPAGREAAPPSRRASTDRDAAPAARPVTAAPVALTVVDGNAHQLRQVLANLLRNALVHTPAGTAIRVVVEPAQGDAARGGGLAPRVVRVTVRDHGPGLPTEEIDSIFERFWRAEGGRERGRGGAGLGLAIVAGIVDAHGGAVRAQNAVGGGASFTVTLPAR